jgi:hypothetical protein
MAEHPACDKMEQRNRELEIEAKKLKQVEKSLLYERGNLNNIFCH